MKLYSYCTDHYNGFFRMVPLAMPGAWQEIETDGPIVSFAEILQSTDDETLMKTAAKALPFQPTKPDALRVFLLCADPHCMASYAEKEGEEETFEWMSFNEIEAIRLEIVTALALNPVHGPYRRIEKPKVLTEDWNVFWAKED